MNTSINKSRLFTIAWKGFRTSQAKGYKSPSFAKSLKWAWGVLKAEAQKIELGKVLKQTAKAIQVAVFVFCPNTDQSSTRKIWIPKSQISDHAIPAWLWSVKKDDVENSINYNGSLIIEMA